MSGRRAIYLGFAVFQLTMLFGAEGSRVEFSGVLFVAATAAVAAGLAAWRGVK